LLAIRQAENRDKDSVLDFCKNTFSWGDYIANVWNLWVAEGEFLVLEYRKRPVGICHAYYSEKQTWIEGLRINPRFRRRGFASKLILHAETTGKTRGSNTARMLIAHENTQSLKLAKSLGYYIEGRWWLYYAEPKSQTSKAKPAANQKQAQILDAELFTESWKWHPLDKRTIESLVRKKRILKHGNALGIWNKSKIDKNMLQIGYLGGGGKGIGEIIKFVQNRGHRLKSKRIQILAREDVDLCGQVDKRMLFCLMRKDL